MEHIYPMRTEHALSEYCMCSNTALQLLVFCTARVCLRTLSSLTEASADPEILLQCACCSTRTVSLTEASKQPIPSATAVDLAS